MLRMSCIAILAGTIWLAYSAVPESSAQRRLDRIVGINLESDPSAQALNTSQSTSQPVASRTRSAFQVFGTRPQERAETVTEVVHVTYQQRAGDTSRELPPPTRNPWHLAPELTRIALAPSSSSSNNDGTGTGLQAQALVGESTTPNAAAATDAESDQAAADLPLISPTSTQQTDTPDMPALTPREQRTLARHIQRELIRVGCYRGVVDGIWGRSSRKALRAFADSMSATIPLEEPGYVALMLVETYDAKACANRAAEPKTILATRDPQGDTTPSSDLDDQLAQTQFASHMEVQSLPGANPRRANARDDEPEPTRHIVASNRNATAVRPRVAGSTIRKQTSSTLTTLARVQTSLEDSEISHEASGGSPEQTTPTRVNTRLKRRNSRARRRAIRRAHRRARIRAYKRRAKRNRVVRKRRNIKRSYGFKSHRRSWVRHAFAHKG